MKRKLRLALRAGLWVGTLSTFGIVAVEYIPQLPGWTNKMPEWVGAIGAIGAFGGTIVIASTESWRRRRAENDLAIIAGAEIIDRLREYLVTVDILSSIFLPEIEPMSRELLDGYKGKLLEEQMWGRDEIMPLVVLPDEVAPRLQRVAARHRRLIKNMELLKYATWPANVSRLYALVHADLQKSRDDLIRCRNEIEHTLRGMYKVDDHMS